MMAIHSAKNPITSQDALVKKQTTYKKHETYILSTREDVNSRQCIKHVSDPQLKCWQKF